MNLPNYYLVDLPPEAALTPTMVGEACQTLKHNRERYLLPRTSASIVFAIADLAANWLKPEFPFREQALTHGPAATGFSAATLTRGLDSFFRQLTAENLQRLLRQDLGHEERLDRLVANETEAETKLSAVATGPELIAHITAGNIPSSTLSSMVLGLLARSAQFVKLARGGAFIPRLFAHSLYQAEPKLGACLELAEWPGGHDGFEPALWAEADCVTANGSDETLHAIRKQLTHKHRFLGYGHRVSFGFVAKEMLMPHALADVAADAAIDVAAWNQLGCLSPHVIYVEKGGKANPEQFAEHLADQLERLERIEPRGELPVEHAAAIASRRSFYEIRSVGAPGTMLWSSRGSTAWTVVYEEDPRWQMSCLNRFIYVKAAENLTEALQGADPVMGKVSTVGVAAPPLQTQLCALQLARWGVPRVCPLGKMQDPPLSWRHDGRPALGDLLTWTNWEQ